MRTIHPEICTDKRLAEMDNAAAERTYMRLWTYCDDDGRALDDPRLIKAALYPRLDSMTPERVESDIALLAEKGFIIRYEIDGETYLCVPSFGDWQKPNHRVASKHPDPPTGDVQTDDCPTEVHVPTEDVNQSPCIGVGVGVVEGVGVGVCGVSEIPDASPATPPPDSPPSASPKRKSQVPKDFPITDSMRSWAADKGFDCDLGEETEKFVDHFTGKGEAKIDWEAAWRNWIRNSRKWPARGARGDPRRAGANALVAKLREAEA